MALLLHLTDLHLSTDPHIDDFDDYSKSEIVPQAERAGRADLIRNTLSELDVWLRSKSLKLDAVAVTGDITYQNQLDGFKQLDHVLTGLGVSRPANDHIVVVPGNHDVAWTTRPSTEVRYERFLEYVRKAGLVTPLLDGVDFDTDGTLKPGVDVTRNILDDPAVGWTILPLNSSNYCGSVEGFASTADEARWKKIPECFDGEERTAVEKMLLRSRLYDVARFSPGQLKAVRALVRDRTAPVRIALLHHHLLPVSEREEVKPYESIVNLGLIRAVLASNRVNVVLHGHKHEGASYWEELQRADGTTEVPHRILVISGATLGGTPAESEVARLLDVNTNASAPTVRWSQIPAMRHGTTRVLPSGKLERLWSSTQPQANDGVKVVTGETVSETYARLNDLFNDVGHDRSMFYVVAQVRTPSDAARLPERYPSDFPVDADAKERDEQFAAIVEWWQRESSELSSNRVFTHGARLFANKDRLVNSLKLQDKARAVTTLLRPTDEIDNEDVKFPAFCLAQFFVTDDKLACIGYFRKQEVRYWWPVNVAELARTQGKLIRQLKKTYGFLQPGPITTIAAVAVSAKHPPRVAIPLIDRLIDDEASKDELFKKTYALVRGDRGTKEANLKFWMRVLDDLMPSEEPAPDGTPVSFAGVRYVKTQLGRFASFHGEVKELQRLFADLYRLNMEHEDVAVGKNDTYDQWRDQSADLLRQIRVLIQQRLTP